MYSDNYTMCNYCNDDRIDWQQRFLTSADLCN